MRGVKFRCTHILSSCPTAPALATENMIYLTLLASVTSAPSSGLPPSNTNVPMSTYGAVFSHHKARPFSMGCFLASLCTYHSDGMDDIALIDYIGCERYSSIVLE